MSGYGLVAIGASWGGLRALETVLAALPADFPAAVVVAQHRDPDADGLLTELLGRHSVLPVSEAGAQDEVAPGRVVVAPAGYHLLVDRGCVGLSTEAAVHFSRPSVDVLLESAAEAYGAEVVGVVLTGANPDGAAGLAAVHRHGGHTIVQDPDTAERREMPEAAIAASPVDEVLALEAIGGRLAELCGRGAAAR
jgi:two-component system chemotaxis response regulator CheB